MTTAFARFRGGADAQQKQQHKQDARVGEILSDSSSSSGDAQDAKTRRSTRESSGGGGGGQSAAKIRQLPARRTMKKTGSRKWYSDSEDEAAEADATTTTLSAKKEKQKQEGEQKKRGSNNSSRADASGHNSEGEKEDGEDEQEVHNVESDDSDLEKVAATAGSKQPRRQNGASRDQQQQQQQHKAIKNLKTLNTAALSTSPSHASDAATHQVFSPTSESETPRGGGGGAPDPLAKKKSGFQKFVAKTFSPFGSRRKGFESPSALNSSGDPAAVGKAKAVAVLSPASDIDSRKPSADPAAASKQPTRNSGKRQSTVGDVASPLSSKGSRSNSTSQSNAETPSIGQLVNRRTSQLKQSPGNAEIGSVPRSVDSPREAAARRAFEAAVAASGGSNDVLSGNEALSPGQRKTPGAFLGPAGSGVLLEGWLRQKQRRGVKGMKRWNARYFVLYAKSNEVRYYADVVQSAWGPIPLGEIGSISLRLIQKISKPSHPKYRGCRFDITCRYSWGTHYADDYVSSDEENSNNSNNNNSVNDADASKQERTSTPRSSRMYSLIADSPQTTVMWMSALDSLLVRSANSPRLDVTSGSAGAGSAPGSSGGSKPKRAASMKAAARHRSSVLETETLVLAGAGDNVPKPVAFAIKYIFDSTPGIETALFYESEHDAAKLKVRASKLLVVLLDGTDTLTLALLCCRRVSSSSTSSRRTRRVSRRWRSSRPCWTR